MSPSALVFSWSRGCHGNSYDSSCRDPVQIAGVQSGNHCFKSKRGKKRIRSKLIRAVHFSFWKSESMSGGSWWWARSFLDSALFGGEVKFLLFPPPDVEMRASTIKHDDGTEEVVWAEPVGSREAGGCLPVVWLSLGQLAMTVHVWSSGYVETMQDVSSGSKTFPLLKA